MDRYDEFNRLIDSDDEIEVARVGLQLISQIKSIEETFDDFNSNLKDRLAEEREFYEDAPVSRLSRPASRNESKNRDDEEEYFDSGNLVDSLKSATFQVRLAHAQTDLISPLTRRIGQIEEQNRDHSDLLQEKVSSRLERVIHELRTSRTHDTTLMMRTASFYRELVAHPMITLATGINKGLQATVKPFLFGFSKNETEQEKTTKAIKQQTEYLRTGAVDKTDGWIRAIFGRGLIPHAAQGMLALTGVRRGVAQEREDALAQGKEVSGIRSWLSHKLYSESIVQRDREGGLLNKGKTKEKDTKPDKEVPIDEKLLTANMPLVKQAEKILEEVHELFLSSRNIEKLLSYNFGSIIDLNRDQYSEIRTGNTRQRVLGERTLDLNIQSDKKTDEFRHESLIRGLATREFEESVEKHNAKQNRNDLNIVKNTKTTANETKKARLSSLIGTIVGIGVSVVNAIGNAITATSSIARTGWTIATQIASWVGAAGLALWGIRKGKAPKPGSTPKGPPKGPPGAKPQGILGRAAGFAGKAVAPALVGMSGYEAYQNVQNDGSRILSEKERDYRATGAGVGAGAGALAGIGLGALIAGGIKGGALGTAAGGPVGTVLGAIAGTVVGGYAAYKGSQMLSPVGDAIGGYHYRKHHVNPESIKGEISSRDFTGVIIESDKLKEQADKLGISFKAAAKEFEKAGGHVADYNGEIVRYSLDLGKKAKEALSATAGMARDVAIAGAGYAKDAAGATATAAKDTTIASKEAAIATMREGKEFAKFSITKGMSLAEYMAGDPKDAVLRGGKMVGGAAVAGVTSVKNSAAALKDKLTPTPTGELDPETLRLFQERIRADRAERESRFRFRPIGGTADFIGSKAPEYKDIRQRVYGGMYSHGLARHAVGFAKSRIFRSEKQNDEQDIFGMSDEDIAKGMQQGAVSRAGTEISRRIIPKANSVGMNIAGGMAANVPGNNIASKLLAGVDRLNIIKSGMAATTAYAAAGNQEGLTEEEAKRRKLGAGIGAGVAVGGASLAAAGVTESGIRRFNVGPPWFRLMVPLIAGAITGGFSSAFEKDGSKIGEKIAARMVTPPQTRMTPVEVRGEVEREDSLTRVSTSLNGLLDAQNRVIAEQHEETVEKNNEIVKVLSKIESNTRNGQTDSFTESPYRAMWQDSVSNSIRGR